jgi:hypothetical protein
MHDDARRAYQKTTSLFYRFAERLSLATGHVYESWRGGSTDMVSLPIPISIYRCMLRVLPSSPVDEALKQDYSEVQKLSHAKFEVCDWRADACDMWCLMRRRVSPATFKVGGDIQSLGPGELSRATSKVGSDIACRSQAAPCPLPGKHRSLIIIHIVLAVMYFP